MSILVTGGARSGKSSFAERWIMANTDQAIYVATAQAFDQEMKERIALHKEQRDQADFAWRTVEEPRRLAELLRSFHSDSSAPTVLVDCLTLWLSNVILAAEDQKDMEQNIREAIQNLAEEIKGYPGQLVLVTNEVGDGIVPEYPLGRVYRDYAGILNQSVARVCEQVFLVTVGIPIELKSREYRL
ncbi:bifunctional adenosylcobinamide kinase/adenosylcobinamide-phosphate guanylyltransferase [Paenibacillus sp.]|jgi:adenosylcobinamide kinase/adenosylcobinamide-phosphate guanylyltransferase|uniref:bifunctional adenosylcobinamide kinase/adenosylcobinamide-phosphate guanylyltransferase n=1 Tax=Paenibacillus sp. TaxID=58172 RepID=UPI0028231575|nr:bifunctional adenosylcobinamide kinase/adenosylcobinamide-phosphate guanylyltransferase [Paenibacillus sp.]MDR0269800.1 bifunctional adenosylcobinamide kinase/adenosylcobinamide-phosphate guanylyltransferase [Paenibacillus sp.]